MNKKPDRRLLLVSNRLPFQLTEKNNKFSIKQSSGGLVTALNSYFEHKASADAFASKMWIGSADFPEVRWSKYQASEQESPDISIEPIFVESKMYNKYYNGFCNATLWPLFHYFTSYMIFDNELFKNYEAVNQLFADKILEHLEPNDVIWIHDYHLFLLPQLIREKQPSATICFFLHIPFPSFEIFRLLHRPWKEKIIRGMLGADLIGFHTQEYVEHFLKTVRMITGYDHLFRSVVFGNRLVKVDIFPLGIDFSKFHSTIHNPAISSLAKAIRTNFQDVKIIFSVDRLDYTKGITLRLLGYQKFLEKHPEWLEKVVFICGVVPSRQIISKYNERKKMIEQQVGRINGQYSNLKWQPLIYRYSHMSFEDLCALYQAADVAFITPLRDGMNLVAKEYVACRDGQNGVLILSELAGAASELGEAVLVNPNDMDELTESIHQALTMPSKEQQRRLSLMQKRLKDYDVLDWVTDILTQLDDVKSAQMSREITFLKDAERQKVIDLFRHSHNRGLFLDYDGTLTPFAKHPSEAIPSPELHQLLSQLISAETHITIISGRDSNILDQWFNSLPVTLVAEHGVSVKRPGGKWQHEKKISQKWKESIRPTLELFTKRCPRSFVEEKSYTLAWHYRNVENNLGFIRSRELLDNLHDLVRNTRLQVIDGNKVIEVRLAGVDKGAAARKLVQENEYDLVMAIGDDKTDEDMFAVLPEEAITIKVGPGPTRARYSLPRQSDVLVLLHQMLNQDA